MRIKAIGVSNFHLAEGKNNIFRNEVLVSIARKRGKTVAQVILRWLTQRDIVVIPKSVRKNRMAENLDIFDFELTQEEMDPIRQLDTGTISSSIIAIRQWSNCSAKQNEILKREGLALKVRFALGSGQYRER